MAEFKKLISWLEDESAPLVCPVCGSDDMSRKDIFEDTDLTVVYVCDEGHKWREYWEFKSYEVV
tara:strand:- start:1967 stop:2158 length:192 start_codon:yes stop_codon:yes gene_type:complete